MAAGSTSDAARATSQEVPAIFHVTHWKAGSTWLARILGRCDRPRIVRPRLAVAHFLEDPIVAGGIYPRVYVTREAFDGVHLPENWRRFIVIRDLRDTLVSAYFSVMLSHTEIPQLIEDRARLQSMGRNEGLAWMLGQSMVVKSAEIQASWLRAGAPVHRYEDILERDVSTLQRILIDDCELHLQRQAVRRIVRQTRFKELSGGRPRGREDVTSHFRKGVAGDWRNHFSERMKAGFKDRWGELLIATGYEQDNDW